MTSLYWYIYESSAVKNKACIVQALFCLRSSFTSDQVYFRAQFKALQHLGVILLYQFVPM